jgi:hypothetical protein
VLLGRSTASVVHRWTLRSTALDGAERVSCVSAVLRSGFVQPPLSLPLCDLRAFLALGGLLSAAIRAEELRGKLRGFYVEKVEHSSSNEFAQMTDEQLRDFIIRETKALGIDIGHSVSRNLGQSNDTNGSAHE